MIKSQIVFEAILRLAWYSLLYSMIRMRLAWHSPLGRLGRRREAVEKLQRLDAAYEGKAMPAHRCIDMSEFNRMIIKQWQVHDDARRAHDSAVESELDAKDCSSRTIEDARATEQYFI